MSDEFADDAYLQARLAEIRDLSLDFPEFEAKPIAKFAAPDALARLRSLKSPVFLTKEQADLLATGLETAALIMFQYRSGQRTLSQRLELLQISDKLSAQLNELGALPRHFLKTEPVSTALAELIDALKQPIFDRKRLIAAGAPKNSRVDADYITYRKYVACFYRHVMDANHSAIVPAEMVHFVMMMSAGRKPNLTYNNVDRALRDDDRAGHLNSLKAVFLPGLSSA